MENEEIKNENLDVKNTKSIFVKIILILFSIVFLLFLIVLGITIYNNSKVLYIPSYDVTCKYQPKFNKIICTQIGDVVPAWLDIDGAPLLKYLGGDSAYTMQLVLSHSNRDYKVLNMTDMVFIKDRNRKFIYELKEQSHEDWVELKKYAQTGSIGNWGSVVLYCSEDNLKDDVCIRMKKNHR